MASLNLSTNGPSISKSYQSIVNASPSSNAAAASATYGQWAVFSVVAPLVSAFQEGAGKESLLKVQSTGEGELEDLIEEFSDGRIQFAFVKVKDSNTGLQKNALIGWCGEGVPERTKGYFASHQAAVAKLFQGYHVQISARSERDLTPEGIVQKLADASGAKYSNNTGSASTPAPAPPPSSKKPVFTASASNTTGSSFNPLAARRGLKPDSIGPVDDDGWGEDAPPVTRTQLEKVESAYQPTKVNMSQLMTQKQMPPQATIPKSMDAEAPNVVKGSYQPIGKVDIAAIRKQAAESGQLKDERPEPVKGAYEPVGKIDMAEIKARARQTPESPASRTAETPTAPDEAPRALEDRAAVFQNPGRLAELPKPKVSSRMGSSGAFSGTKAPVPGSFGLQSAAPNQSTPMGAGRTFADSAVKSPAQIWAEKKAAQGGTVPVPSPPVAKPVVPQNSGGWKSGYGGKKWAPVQISQTGASATSGDQQSTEDAVEESQGTNAARDIASIRDQFSQPQPVQPPELNIASKPNNGGGIPIPGLRTREDNEDVDDGDIAPAIPSPVQPRTPTPEQEEDTSSPVRIAMPVARGNVAPVHISHNEPSEPPQTIPHHEAEEVPDNRNENAALPTESGVGRDISNVQAEHTQSSSGDTGKRAVAQYDYEKAEDNELELREGEQITHIEMVDADWWMGQNSRGETGLFPSTYVEIVEAEETVIVHADPTTANSDHAKEVVAAIAQYDYEAAEDNELSFPAGAKITKIEFPDEDWWSGEYNGAQGLFPANYVELEK